MGETNNLSKDHHVYLFFFIFFKIQICSTVPSFDKLVRGNQTIISQEAWELLDWSLDRTFTLKTVDKSKVFELPFQCKLYGDKKTVVTFLSMLVFASCKGWHYIYTQRP